jgi:hypothetical protein
MDGEMGINHAFFISNSWNLCPLFAIAYNEIYAAQYPEILFRVVAWLCNCMMVCADVLKPTVIGLKWCPACVYLIDRKTKLYPHLYWLKWLIAPCSRALDRGHIGVFYAFKIPNNIQQSIRPKCHFDHHLLTTNICAEILPKNHAEIGNHVWFAMGTWETSGVTRAN